MNIVVSSSNLLVFTFIKIFTIPDAELLAVHQKSCPENYIYRLVLSTERI